MLRGVSGGLTAFLLSSEASSTPGVGNLRRSLSRSSLNKSGIDSNGDGAAYGGRGSDDHAALAALAIDRSDGSVKLRLEFLDLSDLTILFEASRSSQFG